jgi:hypothetical protein
MEEIESLKDLLENVDNGFSLDIIPDDLVVPPGALYCGRCSGCGENHLIPDPNFIFNDEEFFCDEHLVNPCGCPDPTTCEHGNCLECQNAEDCIHQFIPGQPGIPPEG